MKVVHYLPRVLLAEGGVVRAVLDVCAVMARRGHDVTLVTHDATDAPASWKGGGAGVPTLHVVGRPALPLGFFSPTQMVEMRTIVQQADILHLHTPWERANIQFAGLARHARKPYVLTVHGMLDEWCMGQRGLKKRLYLRLAGRRLLDRASAVHCTAEAEREQAAAWFDRHRAKVIPLVFDLDPFRTLPGVEAAMRAFNISSERSPVVLFLGRLHPKKGVELLIEAAATLRDRAADARTLIAGTGEPGYEAALRANIASRGLDDRVRLLGMVTGVEKVSLLELADVFVLPTSQENFGLVIPESLACETPVITTRGVDIWPTIEQAGCAEIVHPLSAVALADAIGKLLNDDHRRRAMGKAGREWVFSALDPDVIAVQYEAMYEEGRLALAKG